MHLMMMKKSLDQLAYHEQQKYFRETLVLPWNIDENLQFKLVSNIDEYLEASKLMHDIDVQNNKMNPDPKGFKILAHDLLPSTIIAIAKYKGKIISTMTLIRDNPLGLPMELYHDLSTIRQNGEIICELSSPYFHHDFLHMEEQVIYPFMRYLWKYAYEWYGVDYITVSSHPSMKNFFESIFLFQPIPNPKKGTIKSVALYNPIKTSYQNFKNCYGSSQNILNNLYLYMQNSHTKCDYYPNFEYFQIRNNYLNPNFILNLKDQVTDFDQRFDEKTKSIIANKLGFYSYDKIGLASPERLRFDMNGLATISTPFGEHSFLAKVLDISKEGLKIHLFGSEALNFDTPSLLLKIQLGPNPNTRSSIIAEPKWHNSKGQVGFKVKAKDAEWFRLIMNMKKATDNLQLYDLQNNLSA